MMVYDWFPMTIGEINDKNTLIIKYKKKTPTFFKKVRGSTNGIRIGDEIWFLCHVVSYDERRYYYHLFVVIDCNTFDIKRFSKLFTFECQKVEYTLGFIYIEELKQFMIGYSIMDKETKYVMISRAKVDALCIDYLPETIEL
jgi:hypothetical protein